MGFGETGFGDVVVPSDFPADLLDLLTSVVGIKPKLSNDDYGKPTYGSSTNYQARISERHVKIRDANGEEVFADGKVLIGGHPIIPPDSKIIHTRRDHRRHRARTQQSPYRCTRIFRAACARKNE